MHINQLLPGFGSGDAISNYARTLQGIIRSWGFDSSIYSVSRHVTPTVERLCEDYRRCPSPGDPSDITIYHYSIGSELSGFFAGLNGRRVLVYHNITPHHFFQGIHDEKMKALWEGREELKSLAGVPDLALGVSEFNRRELEQAGFGNTGVIPLALDRQGLSAPPDRDFIARYGDGPVNILFIGRMAPNKKIEDLIKIFFYYRKSINEDSRLLLAGATIGMDRYLAHLRMLITSLDIPDVTFFDHVTDPQLYALYRTASVFVCMSEHEGVCIPLLEAAHFRVPVVAYAAGAIPETLGGCGALVREKDHAAVAELIQALAADERLRDAVVRKQLTRLDAFSPEAVEKSLRAHLAPWIFSTP